MDPAFITTELWKEFGGLLTRLIFFVIFTIGFGATFLVAHAIIPSLATMGDFSEDVKDQQIRRMRAVFYVGALASLTAAIVFLVLTIRASGVLGDVYDRWWI